jgi:hypothetical protein
MLASVAAQVTVVGPSGKVEPLAGLQMTLTPGQLSLAVAVKFTTAPQSDGVTEVPTSMSVGQVRIGG